MFKLIWKKEGSVVDKACLLWFLSGIMVMVVINLFMGMMFDIGSSGFFSFFQFIIAVITFLIVIRVTKAKVF